jgi:hypothetical protein
MSYRTEFDGVFLSRVTVQQHEGRIYRELTQPNEDVILEDNKRLRNLQQRKLDWGRWVGRFSASAWEMLSRKYPELRSGDKRTREKKVLEILRSPEGAPFLVVDKRKV